MKRSQRRTRIGKPIADEERFKVDFRTSCQYPTTSQRWEQLAVRNMVKNIVIFSRQTDLRDTRKRKGSRRCRKDFQINPLIASHKWQLDGRKKSVENWVNLHEKTNLSPLPEKNVQDTKITVSCLSTARDPCRPWTRGKTTRKP